MLNVLVRKYIKEIEPELLKLKGTDEIDEILDLFKEHVTESERTISGEYDFFDSVSNEKRR